MTAVKEWGSCEGISLWRVGHFGVFVGQVRGKTEDKLLHLVLGRPLYELRRADTVIAAGPREAIEAAWRLLVSTMPEDTAPAHAREALRLINRGAHPR